MSADGPLLGNRLSAAVLEEHCSLADSLTPQTAYAYSLLVRSMIGWTRAHIYQERSVLLISAGKPHWVKANTEEPALKCLEIASSAMVVVPIW